MSASILSIRRYMTDNCSRICCMVLPASVAFLSHRSDGAPVHPGVVADRRKLPIQPLDLADEFIGGQLGLPGFNAGKRGHRIVAHQSLPRMWATPNNTAPINP